MGTNLDSLIDELAAAESNSAAVVEGYDDVISTDVFAGARDYVSQARNLEIERQSLVEAARVALTRLRSHGYPRPLLNDASPEVIAAIEENIRSMQLALQYLTPAEATQAEIAFGTAQLK